MKSQIEKPHQYYLTRCRYTGEPEMSSGAPEWYNEKYVTLEDYNRLLAKYQRRKKIIQALKSKISKLSRIILKYKETK